MTAGCSPVLPKSGEPSLKEVVADGRGLLTVASSDPPNTQNPIAAMATTATAPMPSNFGLNDEVSPLSPNAAGAAAVSFFGSSFVFLPDIDLVTVETMPVIVSVKLESSPNASSRAPPPPASESLFVAVIDFADPAFFSGATFGFAAAGLVGAAFFGSGRAFGFCGACGAAAALPFVLNAESGASR